METKEIQYRDGTTNRITVFRPIAIGSNEPNGITCLCLPAMGVRASWYELFAKSLCQRGFNVITADYRGQGNSSVRASRNIDYGYEVLVGDVNELVERADTWFPNTQKFIVGHSLGGQIGSLFQSRYLKVSGLILMTACSVHYKGWENWDRIKVLIAGNIFYPLSKVVGHFPGNRIGFGGREGRTLIKDWSYNALHGVYKLSNSSHDYEISLKEMNTRVLSVSIENDWLANRQSVKNLYDKFSPASAIAHVHVTSAVANVSPLTHFNWAKNPDYFIRLIEEWIQEKG